MSGNAQQPSSNGVLVYTPSIAGNAVFGVLYQIVAALLLTNLIKRNDWWGLCLPIGACFQGIGFFIRIVLATSDFSLSLYIPEEFFIVLSPACYLAFNYIWFGRLCQRYEDSLTPSMDKKGRKHVTFLSPRKFGLIFILSDVTTFLIQAGGGGMQVNEGLHNVGATIFLIGIVAQFASYVFFLSLSIPVILSMRRANGASPTERSMTRLFCVLYFSSAWIIVRSIYRTIELAQGYGGPLQSKEAYFFGLDSTPLLLAVSIYVFFWPSSFVELKVVQKDALYTVPWEAGRHMQQITLSACDKPGVGLEEEWK